MRAIAIAALVALGIPGGLGACGARRSAPTDPVTYALFRDLERDVTVQSATGWSADRIEVEAMLPGALDSVCRVDPLARTSLRAWVDSEQRTLGGPVEEAYRARGHKLSKVDDLLVVTRVSMLLARAEQASGDCPFWVERDDHFRGRQISEHTWQLVLSTGGQGIAIAQDRHTDFSAGGSGRVLLGRTFAGGDGLYVGAELGGSAAFPKDASGMRSHLVIGADLVAPLVYRHTFLNTFYEGEAGWVGRATESDWAHVDQGVHVGFAFGGRALRKRFLFPGATLGIAWEHTFVDGPDITTIKIGARVSFDIDL